MIAALPSPPTQVLNVAVGGVTSQYWCDEVAAIIRNESSPGLLSLMPFDIVLVETANNDLNDPRNIGDGFSEISCLEGLPPSDSGVLHNQYRTEARARPHSPLITARV